MITIAQAIWIKKLELVDLKIFYRVGTTQLSEQNIKIKNGIFPNSYRGLMFKNIQRNNMKKT